MYQCLERGTQAAQQPDHQNTGFDAPRRDAFVARVRMVNEAARQEEVAPGAPFMCTSATTTGAAARGPSSARGIQERSKQRMSFRPLRRVSKRISTLPVGAAACSRGMAESCTHLNRTRRSVPDPVPVVQPV